MSIILRKNPRNLKEINEHELRVIADRLWGGEVRAVQIMGQIHQFNKDGQILRWLDRNNIRGQRLIDFFNESEGVETMGVLAGISKILNYINNDKFNKDPLTVKELKK